MTINDLEFVEEVAVTRRARIWRATLKEDGQSFVIKSVQRSDDVGSTRCRNHFNLTRQNTIAGVVGAYDLIEEPDGIHLVMEDAGGVSLQGFLVDHHYDLDTLLILAEQIADALDLLHAQRILHRDLSLANVVVQPHIPRATIVDLGLAIKLQHDVDGLSRDVMEGTLAYISPEQTGRLRKVIDHRSDLYSFGAVLYHMITGSAPFQGNDALEVMHAHVTRLPASPRQLNSSIPIPLDSLIMQLLEKEPEARYQSAFGIAEDLRRIRKWLKSADDHKELPLAHIKTSVTYHFPQTVVGRDQEIDQLHSIVHKAFETKQQLALLSGVAGSGKSMIVRGFLDRMPRNGVIITDGKYEQFATGQPLTGLGHALEHTIRSILRKSSADLDQWRVRITTAVGEDAPLLAAFIPSLHLLVQNIQELPSTGAHEARVRLISSLVRLIEAVAKGASGLVLILEDLHWADEATFDVIDLVLSIHTHTPVAVIGTYRTETNLRPDHPLLVWPESPVLADRITASAVFPLSIQSVRTIVTSSLGLTDEQATPLAKALMDRTNGHPLFVSQFLAFLVESGVVTFNRHLQRWTWSADALQSVPTQYSVADVIQARFVQLPESTRQLLMPAALVGSEFSIPLIEQITQRTTDDVNRQLQPAVAAGLLTIEHRHQDVYGRFVHDRVQETAISTIPINSRQELHATIVKAILDSPEHVREALSVFDLADHLMQAGDHVRSNGLRDANIRITCEAAEKARQTGALREALAFALHARELIGSDGWHADHNNYNRITVIAASAAGALGDYEQSHLLFDECLSHLPNGIDAAYVIALQSDVYTRQGQFDDLMKIGYRGLAMLGVSLQARPGKMTLAVQMVKALFQFTQSLVSSRKTQPFNNERRLQIADGLLFQLTSAGYNFSQEMMGHLTFTRGALAIASGHAPSSIDAYCQTGMVFLAIGKIAKAVPLADLSVMLLDHSTDNEAKARTSFISGGHVYFWSKPLPQAISTFEKGIEYAVRSGSQYMVYWGEGVACELHAFSGKPLSEQHLRIIAGLDNLHRVYQRTDNIPWTAHYFLAAVERVIHLYNPGLVIPDVLRELIDREEWLLAEMAKAKDATAMCSWSIGAIKVALATDDLQNARIALERFNKYRHGSVTQWSQAEVELYTALLVGAASRKSTITHADSALLKTSVRRMQKYAKWNPHSFTSRSFLMQGIKAYTEGNMESAFHKFQSAAQSAHTEQNIYIEALATEWTAHAGENSVMSGLVPAIRQKAARTYRLFGAPFLAEKLESRRSQHQQPDSVQRVTVSTTVHSSTAATLSVNRFAFDIDSIFKASSAIAGEIEHQNLVKRLLAIVLENAGADEGALIIDQQGQLQVEASLVSGTDLFTLLAEPFEQSSVVCKPAVHLVNRTNEALVVDEANADPDYATDVYVTKHNVRSMLVIPIHHKGTRIGLLHLVNTHITHAFTPERLEVVQLLTSQIAVSLENARLYDEQQATLRAAARFVPTEFLDALGGKTIRDVQLGDGTRMPITVLFVDIRRFTSISEQLSVDDTFAFLNDYLKLVEPVIPKHQGFVDKYVGDAVMALFPHHPSDAVRAAIEIQHSLNVFNIEQRAIGKTSVQVGIGIHTGEVMLGTVGTGNRMDTTVIGDTVNIAARLEELTKSTNANILISDEVQAALAPNEFIVVERGSETIRGRTNPVKLFEVRPSSHTGLTV